MMIALLAMIAAVPDAAPATAIPTTFESVGSDRRDIVALLDTYTRAVSTKDRQSFEALLLNQDIPFSSDDAAVASADRKDGSRNYADFRKNVFGGAPFTQRFQDIHIRQDGPLADVTLVYVNTSSDGTSWGWKTLQLLKVAGAWKIASEFYTGPR